VPLPRPKIVSLFAPNELRFFAGAGVPAGVRARLLVAPIEAAGEHQPAYGVESVSTVPGTLSSDDWRKRRVPLKVTRPPRIFAFSWPPPSPL
jgi:hypothetical protein